MGKIICLLPLFMSLLLSCDMITGMYDEQWDTSKHLHTFASADTPGDRVRVTAGSVTFNMNYANNSTGIVFPTGTDDLGIATISNKFFIGETAVTNALFAAVLQWAKDNGKFSTTESDHNGLSSATAKYGAQELIDLDYNSTYMKISYASGTFSVASGYENYPVVFVSWYGAIMFCNWLTEMKDGNTTNVVYSGIDTTWTHTETVETATKTGYRLPSSEEWEYAARYIGSTAPTAGNLATEYVAQSVHGGSASLTADYYWTPGDYASGATKDYTNFTECNAVAWFGNVINTSTGNTLSVQSVAQKTANALGLRDMSGNVLQWCFTPGGYGRVLRGGSWFNDASFLRVGGVNSSTPDNEAFHIGFRFARTQ